MKTLPEIIEEIRHGGSLFVPCLDVTGVKRKGEAYAIGERLNIKGTVGIHGGLLGVMFTRYKDGKPLPAPSGAPE